MLKFIRLHRKAKLPSANGSRAMAIDLCSVEDVTVGGNAAVLVNTGIVLAPESYDLISGMQLSLRSGFALKSGCIMANGVGLIEPDFAGFELNSKVLGISVPLIYSSRCGGFKVIEASTRIAQLLVWSRDGRLLVPDEGYTTSWANGCDLYQDRDFWYNSLGPGAGGRSGFGSTGQ